MNYRAITAGILAGAVALAMGAPAQAAETYKIGVVTPLSGKISIYGEGFRKAMELAVDKINAAGGVKGRKLEIIFEDNGSTSQGSVSAIQKHIAIRKLPLVFGPGASSNFLAVCPIAQNAKVVLIAAESAAAKISNCGSYVYRVFPSDKLQGKGVSDLVKRLKVTSVALTYINNDWGVGLAEVFKANFTAAGGKIVGEFAHDEGKTDYRAEVLRLKNYGAKYVVNLTYLKEGATILKQAMQNNFRPQWIMGSATRSGKLVKLAGKAAEGVIGTYPTVARDRPPYKEYLAAWKAKYPVTKPAIFGEYNYDMVMVAARAIAGAKTYTAEAIRKALPAAGKSYTGATGNKAFTAQGDIIDATYGVWTVKDGKITDYKK